MAIKRNKCTNRGVPYQGFTLIELLAVIVILAIIALIATPIVLNIIDDTKESSQLRSAEFYLDAVEQAIAKQMMDDTTFKPTSCEIQDNGNLKCDEKEVKVEVNGEMPSGGYITIENGKIKDLQLVLNNKTMVKDDDKWYYSGLYDENDNLIATWDELVNDYGIDIEDVYSDHNGNLWVDESLLPGIILSTNVDLKQGTMLVIDSSVNTIGGYALGRNISLKKIIIPGSVTNIGYWAFANITSLTEIIIPNNVTKINHYTFNNCTNLKEIVLPGSITSIEAGAFNDCTSLKEIVLPKSVTRISTSFQRCTGLKEIILPNGITEIPGSFKGCTSLEKIIIPDSVTKIGYQAFYGCKNLKLINYIGTEEDWNLIQFGGSWNTSVPTDYTINYNYIG